MFGQRTQAGNVQDMLTYDPTLAANDELYQALLHAMTNRDFEALESLLEKRSTSILSS